MPPRQRRRATKRPLKVGGEPPKTIVNTGRWQDPLSRLTRSPRTGLPHTRELAFSPRSHLPQPACHRHPLVSASHNYNRSPQHLALRIFDQAIHSIPCLHRTIITLLAYQPTTATLKHPDSLLHAVQWIFFTGDCDSLHRSNALLIDISTTLSCRKDTQ